ncbi:MAG: glycoside hydrolase family 25 protein [Atopobiaceae bacterium]|nr:glycoside hydrolase family 25 protein [Atopobiaceae bacterium]
MASHRLDSSWSGSATGTSPFDRDCFVYSDGRYSYQDGSLVITKTGVDVSDHKGHIDWEAVANDGVSFAIVRVGYRGNTEGNIHADELFEQNLTGARDAGLECGVYFYSQAVSVEEAREEAHFVLDQLGSRRLEYPVVFDYELNDGNRIANVDDETASACARAFCDVIIEAGYEPMLYGNGYDLRPLDLSQLDDCQIWYAEYGNTPSRTGAFSIWQYSESGSVDGFSSTADLNLDLSEAL